MMDLHVTEAYKFGKYQFYLPSMKILFHYYYRIFTTEINLLRHKKRKQILQEKNYLFSAPHRKEFAPKNNQCQFPY